MDNGPALFSWDSTEESAPDAVPAGTEAAGTGAAVEPADAGAAASAVDVAHPDLRMSLEAVLLVADEPVSAEVLAEVTGEPAESVAAELHALADSYTEQRRGFDLREVAGGWRLERRARHA